MGVSSGAIALNLTVPAAAESSKTTARKKSTPTVMGAFLYPPSSKLHGNWWSWPGNDFDAEGRQKQYMARIKEMETELGMKILMEEKPFDEAADATSFINKIKRTKPDGLLLIPFKHSHITHADRILKEFGTKTDKNGKVTKQGIPTVISLSLGVKHGPITQYRKPGIYMISSLDNMDAIEFGMRAIQTRRLMKDSRIISVAGTERREGIVPFWGTQVRVVPLKHFEEMVNITEATDAVKKLARSYVRTAKKVLEPEKPEILQAAKVHFANQRILEEEGGDAMMMDCLRRGELMPCMSFMTLRDRGIAAGCENDLGPTLTMMLVQHLFDRPGFQHNPAFETEANHYFASHCTSASKLFGISKRSEPYLLRNYGHTNDPTCAPQVLFREGEDVTMARCNPTEAPSMQVYSGQVVKSYDMPPVGGCRTNVEIRSTNWKTPAM